jgi:hypothetical protein
MRAVVLMCVENIALSPFPPWYSDTSVVDPNRAWVGNYTMRFVQATDHSWEVFYALGSPSDDISRLDGWIVRAGYQAETGLLEVVTPRISVNKKDGRQQYRFEYEQLMQLLEMVLPAGKPPSLSFEELISRESLAAGEPNLAQVHEGDNGIDVSWSTVASVAEIEAIFDELPLPIEPLRAPTHWGVSLGLGPYAKEMRAEVVIEDQSGGRQVRFRMDQRESYSVGVKHLTAGRGRCFVAMFEDALGKCDPNIRSEDLACQSGPQNNV